MERNVTLDSISVTYLTEVDFGSGDGEREGKGRLREGKGRLREGRQAGVEYAYISMLYIYSTDRWFFFPTLIPGL